ncbi:hypothetical protein SDC9_99383 [bioreactor metagenome]|uniref:Uncharacterized protein n=1 Tax=bioreactor metagenome TaxID=1076179 RepID=A0A645AP51_9ZZZZ
MHDTAQLQYLRVRYYNTRLAQFISEDSYTGTDDNPLSQNRYTFAADNPFKYRDPSGHRIASVIDELSGGSKTTTKPQGSGSTGASVTGSIKKITDTATTAVSGISSNTYKPSDPKLILTDPIAAIAEVNDLIARSGVNKAEVKEGLAKENSLVERMKMFGVGKPIVNSSKTPFATVINKLMADDKAKMGTGNLGFDWEWTGNYVTDEFKTKVLDISKNLQIDPDDLMAVMAFESWIDPTTVNSLGYTGLIQFGEDTAKGLGTTTAALKKMSAVEQLDYVYMYLEPLATAGKLTTLSDIYISILSGRNSTAIGKPDSTILWSSGTKKYNANKGLDMNGDGNITKAEATQMVIDRRNTYKKIQ